MGRAKVIPPNTLLLPYQSAWVKDRSRLKLAVKARQIGWSWASAYSIIRRKAVKDAQLDAWISSRDEIQAKLFLDDCKGFGRLLHAGAQDLGERVIDDKGNSAFVLQMANGLRVHSLSSNPDAQAGKRGDRILDEAGLHKDFKALYDIAYPGITWGGQLEIFSTPRGSQQHFSILLKEITEGGNPKGFSFHKVSLEDALSQGFLFKLQQKLPKDDERQEMDEAQYFDFVKRGCTDEETFMQEYMCVPSNDETAFISYDLLNKCRVRGHVENDAHVRIEANKLGGEGITYWVADDPIGAGNLFLGVDIGRRHDLTVAWLGEETGGVLFPRKIGFFNKVTFRRQEKTLRVEFLDLENLVRACFDETGIGEQMAENAQADYGSKVEPVRFTAEVKEHMAFGIRNAMEDANFRTPDAARVESSFRKIKKTTTISGNIRFDGERDEDGHADDFWGGALCQEAKGKKSRPAAWAPVVGGIEGAYFRGRH